MKRFVLAALVALALPLAALANNVEVVNSSGTLMGSAAGLSLTSNLIEITLGSGPRGSDIGTVSLSVGPLLSGSLLGGGTFSPASSFFTITINPGEFATVPQGGVLFSGVFTGPVSWSPLSGEPGYYQLLGPVAGHWWTGLYGTGYTSQTYFGTFNANGVFTATSGSGLSFVNPEPSTLALLGTGVIAVIAIARKKLKV